MNVIPGYVGGPGFGSQPSRIYTGELINTLFTDQQHGYVVQRLCSIDEITDVPDDAPTPDVHRECTAQLLTTADGGQTWQWRTLPGDPAHKDAGVELIPRHSLMLWLDDAGRLAFGGWNRQYWTSTDGGSTWTASATPRDIGPDGSFGTFGPGDRLTFLDTPPPNVIVGEKHRLVAATDGSFWVPCDEAACLLVTRDHGATWQQLSTVDGASNVVWAATRDGRTVYASVRTGPAAVRLVRSTDGGDHWTDVLGLAWPPGPDGVVLANGDLILAEGGNQGGVDRLAADGSSLEGLAGAPANPSQLYLTGGVLVAAPTWDQREEPTVGSVVSVSTDGGTTWLTVPAPA